MAFFGAIPQPDDADGNPVESLFIQSNNKVDVTLSVLNDDGTNWFNIKETGGDNITLTKVTLKPGPRADGDPTEIVVIVAGADEVGQAEIKK